MRNSSTPIKNNHIRRFKSFSLYMQQNLTRAIELLSITLTQPSLVLTPIPSHRKYKTENIPNAICITHHMPNMIYLYHI